MSIDPLAPDISPPPREVFEWTRVLGHQVNQSLEPGTAFCGCGQRQKDTRPSHDWRTEHLRSAWPVLVPRLQAEPLQEWRARLIEQVEAARLAAEPEQQRLMEAMDVGAGQPMPVIDEFDLSAEDRLEVLQHQLEGRPFNRMVPF